MHLPRAQRLSVIARDLHYPFWDVVVPHLYRIDLSQWWVCPSHRCLGATILYDYLASRHREGRPLCDRTFARSMYMDQLWLDGVPWWLRCAAWSLERLFGGAPWRLP